MVRLASYPVYLDDLGELLRHHPLRVLIIQRQGLFLVLRQACLNIYRSVVFLVISLTCV